MGHSSNTGARPAVARVRTAVPHLSAVYLPRRRLRDHLDETRDGEVVLVSAPAGYGKTLLLTDWVSRQPGRVAWLTVDRGDNTDRRFWAGVLAALSTVAAVPAANPLRTLGLPDVPSRSPEFLDAVIDALVAVAGPLLMVFDDLHELTNADPLAGLATLLENRPPGLRLVLASRSDPPLHLGRLRLTGELRELRAPALAFTSDEAAAVLERADVHVTPEQHQLLHAQTAGWPAALRLASISLREAADPAAFLSDLTGNGQAISDYLVGEILSSLPDEVVEVLFAVSVCDAVTAPLAATLAGRADAGDALADLEHRTSLVVSYGKGRRWFRVHPLLRAQLYADLRRRRPDRVAALHRRALAWFASTRNPVGALRHATLADNPHLVRDALRKHGAVLATSGHHVEVGAAVERLDGAGLLQTDPRLLLVGALAHMERGQVDAADVLLGWADALPTEPDAALRALRALATARRAWYRPDGPRPDGAAPGAVETELAVVSMLLRANLAMADGRTPEAVELTRVAVEQASGEGREYLRARALATRAMAVGLLGEITHMLELVEQAGRTAPAAAWSHTAGAAYCVVMSAYGTLLQGRLTAALAHTTELQDVTGRTPAAAQRAVSPLQPVLDAVHGATRFDLGEHQAGLDEMRAARASLGEGVTLGLPMAAFLAVLEHDAALRCGFDARARAVCEWAAERVGDAGCGDLTYLRAAAALQVGTEQEVVLAPLLEGVELPLVRWLTGAAWILECQRTLRIGNRRLARDALRHALTHAERSGVVRPLVNAPSEVADLIAREVGGLGGADGLAREVLALRARLESGGLAAPALTAREAAVLDLLPSLLSLDEIAARLCVSTNTVKTHLTAIYAKLGVRSRRDAVARGRLLVR
jgi:LuxR family transcriptional regulator, maltose regulon positive regulatory protein